MKKKINIQRILLTTLVAVAFFGFTLWSIQQSQMEEESLYDFPRLIASISNKEIKIISPKIGTQIKSPVLIIGRVNLSGNRLKIRIKDSQGLVLAEKFASTKNAAGMSDFSVSSTYKKPSVSKGTIEVFLVAAKSGLEMDKIIIPVVFND